MRARRPLMLALAAAFSLYSMGLAEAQDDANVQLMKSIYTKLGQVVGVGSNDPTTGESFLVLANPGILLDPSINTSTIQGRYRLASLVDRVLEPNWIYKPRVDRTFDVYDKVLNGHEAAVVTPTTMQKQKYIAACRIIFTDCQSATPGNYTTAYKRYRSATKALATATKAAEDYQNNNATSQLPPDLQNNLQDALNDLKLQGNATKIEAATAEINTYDHIDPNSWWGELQGRRDKNSQTYSGNQFGGINVYPDYNLWLDKSRSWTSVSLTQGDLEQTTHNSSSSVGGGLSAGWGLWSVGADYSHQENRTFFELTATGAVLSLELSRVDIDRPWLDGSAFASRSWRWLTASPYYNQVISDGADATSGKTPAGVMPFLVTGLLLARNASLSANWDHDLKTTFDSQTSAGGSIGWGPISFGGRTNNSDSSTYRKATTAGNTVSWDAPQIIGFFVQVLPKSPDPDPCLTFPGTPPPAPGQCPASRLRTRARKTTYAEALVRKATTLLSQKQ